MKRPLFLLAFLCFACMHKAHAQYFEFGKVLGDTSVEQGGNLIGQLPDNDYLLQSGYYLKSTNEIGVIFYRTTSKGDIVFSSVVRNTYKRQITGKYWNKTWTYNLMLTPNKYLYYSVALDSAKIKLLRVSIDSTGKNSVSSYKEYYIPAMDSGLITNPDLYVKYIPNECFYIYGQSPYAPDSSYVIWKIDTSGKLIWRQDYFDTCNGYNFNLVVLKNKLLLTSRVDNSRINGVLRMLWMDSIGNVTQEKTFSGGGSFEQSRLLMLPDTGFVMSFDGGVPSGSFSYFPWPLLVKFNKNLDTVWHQYMSVPRKPGHISNSSDATEILKVTSTVDGNIAVWWHKNFADYDNNGDMLTCYLLNGTMKSQIGTDSLLWDYESKNSISIGGYYDMMATSDTGFAFTTKGIIDTIPNGKDNTYLIKLSDHFIITSIDQVEKQIDGIKLYPNPSSSFLILNSTDEFQNAEIKIYNLQGQQIQDYSHIKGKDFLISRNNAPQGLYILQIINNNESQTLKFAWQAN